MSERQYRKDFLHTMRSAITTARARGLSELFMSSTFGQFIRQSSTDDAEPERENDGKSASDSGNRQQRKSTRQSAKKASRAA